ncbi:hypothetical protein [Paenibacillus sanfengchensis]|uniref:hypothetical protein n=1 Tax=Paenibacillus sanfengchensis TaxID=3119819 RepID=UPI002FDF87BD
MTSKLQLTLHMQGIVIFDPANLDRFVKDNGIVSSDLVTYFYEHELVGEEAIYQGVIIPIYPIPDIDYTIYINNSNSNKQIIPEGWKIFETERLFPLTVTSGKLVVSDIESIIYWDPSFYMDYDFFQENRSSSSDAIKLKNGCYGVRIVGFCEPNKGYSAECGYLLELQEREALPNFDFSKSIDQYNFRVDPER